SYREWGSIFGDSIIATAILDRLLHHSTTINIRGESYLSVEGPPQGRPGAAARTGRGGGRGSFLGLGLRSAQTAPKDGAGLHSVRGQGGPFMRFRGGEFSTGTTGNFQPELTFIQLSPDRASLFWFSSSVVRTSGCGRGGVDGRAWR